MRRILLICGILSSLLYGGMVWLIRFEGYSRISQTPSELTAIGVPTRSLWMLFGSMYDALIMAFGVGVWVSADRKRALRGVGMLLFAFGMLGVVWPFASMQQREVLAAGGGTVADTVHLVLGALTVLLMLSAIGSGAAALGNRFRVYSVATLLIVLVFGILTGLDSPGIAANLPTPWVGLWERISIVAFLLWVIVLAIVLLRAEMAYESKEAAKPPSTAQFTDQRESLPVARLRRFL